MTREPFEAAILDMWDRGADRRWVERALAMLEVASGEPRAAVAALPVAERDVRLFALRRTLFGSEIRGLVECPSCGETLESELDLDRLVDDDGERSDSAIVRHDGLDLHVRLPTSVDLREALVARDASVARRVLVERCVHATSSSGDPVPLAQLSAAALDVAAREMTRLDPRGQPEIAFACPACGHEGAAPFDIVSFLWREIEAHARRLLREVHALASAYGWPEREVLSLGARRRRAYLEMVRA